MEFQIHCCAFLTAEVSEFQRRSIKSLMFNCKRGGGEGDLQRPLFFSTSLRFHPRAPIHLLRPLPRLCDRLSGPPSARRAFRRGGGARRMPVPRTRRRREQPACEKMSACETFTAARWWRSRLGRWEVSSEFELMNLT